MLGTHSQFMFSFGKCLKLARLPCFTDTTSFYVVVIGGNDERFDFSLVIPTPKPIPMRVSFCVELMEPLNINVFFECKKKNEKRLI